MTYLVFNLGAIQIDDRLTIKAADSPDLPQGLVAGIAGGSDQRSSPRSRESPRDKADREA